MAVLADLSSLLSPRRLELLIDSCSLIDAHCHSEQYRGPAREQMLREVEDLDILCLTAATDRASIKATARLCEEYPHFIRAAGIHPWEAGAYAPEDLLPLENDFRESIQISEIGMDGLWAPPEATFARQKALFTAQLNLARDLNKPVTLHTKDAEDLILEILKKSPPPSILVHWFAGNSTQLKAYRDLGCFFTIPPAILTYAACRDLIQAIPLNCLLPETDNPGTWPWLFHGQEGRANQIKAVLQGAEALLGVPEEELMDQFRQNLKAFLMV